MINEGGFPDDDDDEVCDHRCCDCDLDGIIFPGDAPIDIQRFLSDFQDRIRTKFAAIVAAEEGD